MCRCEPYDFSLFTRAYAAVCIISTATYKLFPRWDRHQCGKPTTLSIYYAFGHLVLCLDFLSNRKRSKFRRRISHSASMKSHPDARRANDNNVMLVTCELAHFQGRPATIPVRKKTPKNFHTRAHTAHSCCEFIPFFFFKCKQRTKKKSRDK